MVQGRSSARGSPPAFTRKVVEFLRGLRFEPPSLCLPAGGRRTSRRDGGAPAEQRSFFAQRGTAAFPETHRTRNARIGWSAAVPLLAGRRPADQPPRRRRSGRAAQLFRTARHCSVSRNTQNAKRANRLERRRPPACPPEADGPAAETAALRQSSAVVSHSAALQRLQNHTERETRESAGAPPSLCLPAGGRRTSRRDGGAPAEQHSCFAQRGTAASPETHRTQNARIGWSAAVPLLARRRPTDRPPRRRRSGRAAQLFRTARHCSVSRITQNAKRANRLERRRPSACRPEAGGPGAETAALRQSSAVVSHSAALQRLQNHTERKMRESAGAPPSLCLPAGGRRTSRRDGGASGRAAQLFRTARHCSIS